MKTTILASAIMLLFAFPAISQNLYNNSNAASIENESNAVTGWTGTATLESVNTTAQNGIYSLHFIVQGTGREARYSFTAIVGAVYNISIWGRRSSSSNNPAFANWLGMTGAATTVIGSQTWTQYNFTVTATTTNPVIRVYAGPIGAASGSDVFIDAISITAQSVPDTQPPTAPTGLISSNITETSATLSWNASTDNIAVTSYNILQNNVVTGSVSGTTLQYQLTNLTPATTYSYSVTAIDAANNVSAASTALDVTTLSPPADTIPPSIPEGLNATNITSTGLTLSWTASTDNVGVTNYLIYRDSLLPESTGSNSTTFTVTGLTSLTTYNFRVAAAGAAGNISAQGAVLTVSTLDAQSVITWNDLNSNLPTVDWQAKDMYVAGRMGIGTAVNPNFALSVNGNIRAKEIIVESGWSDFVFDPGYYLAPLNEVENFIKTNRHLKDIPTEAQVKADGIGLAEMNKLLLQKVEEITLYLIDANKRITELQQQVDSLKPLY